MSNITTVLAVRNNLEDTKEFYKNFRELYPNAPLVISSGGSIDGTAEWLRSILDSNLDFNIEDSSYTNFSANYNKAISLVKTEKLVLVHNDMILGDHFFEELEKYSQPYRILSYTTIEPPIFPGHNRPGKIIRELGRDFSDFNSEEFKNLTEEIIYYTEPILDEGASFFMSGYKSSFDYIGGFDNKTFDPYFCEDDDILIRFKLAGHELKTLNTALCYHFVSKTSRFSKEYRTKTHQIEQISNKNFIRKWGSRQPKVKYDIGFVVKGNYEFVEALEPWCSNIYINDPHNLIIDKLILKEQPNTSFNLKDRIINLSFNIIGSKNKILVYIDQNIFTQEDFNIIQQLPDIIKDNGDIGKFSIGNMEIEIKGMNEYQNNLIKI